MSYSGNYDADRWYDRRVRGRKCSECGGFGIIMLSGWDDFKRLFRPYGLTFKELLSYARQYSHTGEVECPACGGEGKIY